MSIFVANLTHILQLMAGSPCQQSSYVVGSNLVALPYLNAMTFPTHFLLGFSFNIETSAQHRFDSIVLCCGHSSILLLQKQTLLCSCLQFNFHFKPLVLKYYMWCGLTFLFVDGSSSTFFFYGGCTLVLTTITGRAQGSDNGR